jgi:hypothetical protein
MQTVLPQMDQPDTGTEAAFHFIGFRRLSFSSASVSHSAAISRFLDF